jgi:hypothetical protein
MKDFFGKEIVIGDKVLFSNCNNERILIGDVTEIGITKARIESFDDEGEITHHMRHGWNMVIIKDDKQ